MVSQRTNSEVNGFLRLIVLLISHSLPDSHPSTSLKIEEGELLGLCVFDITYYFIFLAINATMDNQAVAYNSSSMSKPLARRRNSQVCQVVIILMMNPTIVYPKGLEALVVSLNHWVEPLILISVEDLKITISLSLFDLLVEMACAPKHNQEMSKFVEGVTEPFSRLVCFTLIEEKPLVTKRVKLSHVIVRLLG